jgi:hypothetical protein
MGTRAKNEPDHVKKPTEPRGLFYSKGGAGLPRCGKIPGPTHGAYRGVLRGKRRYSCPARRRRYLSRGTAVNGTQRSALSRPRSSKRHVGPPRAPVVDRQISQQHETAPLEHLGQDAVQAGGLGEKQTFTDTWILRRIVYASIVARRRRVATRYTGQPEQQNGSEHEKT